MHFLVKVANIHFLVGKYILLKKKYVYNFSLQFYRQSDVTKSRTHFRLIEMIGNCVLCISARINLYDLIMCVNIAMDMLLEHNNSDLGILKRLH